MKKSIMIFNDTLEILQLFADILTPEGYSVSLRTFTDQDIDAVKSVGPTLVIADCAPFAGEKTGWQLMQKLRMSRDTENVPVLLCSTSLDLIRELEGLLTEKRVIALPKPFTPDELLAAVERLIGKPDAAGLGPISDATLDAPPQAA